MKKIMILLLALAVLFGFAACDNSTPADTDDTEQGGAGLSTQDISDVMDEVLGNLNGGIDASIKAFLGVAATNEELMPPARAGYTVTVDAETYGITISKTVNPATPNGTYPAQVVTLAVKGVETGNREDNKDTGSHPIVLDSFTYTFETYTTTVNNEVQKVTGVIPGYFAKSNTATVTVDPVKGITSYKLDTNDALDIVLFQDEKGTGASLSVEGIGTAASGEIYDAVASGAQNASTYGKVLSDAKSDARDYLKAYADQLVVDATTTDLISTLNGWFSGHDGGEYKYTYDPANGGTLSVQYKRTGNTAIALSAKDSPAAVTDLQIALSTDDYINVTFTDPDTTATVSTVTFTPKAYTIEGVLTAQNYNTSDSAFADDSAIEDAKITVNLSGDVKGVAVTVDNTAKTASAITGTSQEFGRNVDSTVVANVLLGPALGEAKADSTMKYSVDLAPVEVTYTATTTTNVL